MRNEEWNNAIVILQRDSEKKMDFYFNKTTIMHLFKCIILSFFLLHNFIIEAQERYLQEISESVKIETYTYANKEGQNLDLDVYIPGIDTASQRVVYLFVHGGGFSGGSRNGVGIQKFCKKIAQRGYVAVSISYRLTRKGKTSRFGCDCPANEKMKTFQAAVEDIHDATSFLIENREKFGIDPDEIILSGSSAGAEAVLNAAYEPWRIEGKPVIYAGVISFAGAIPDTGVITKETAIPTFLFHGTCDNLVPYATAPHHYCDKQTVGYLMLSGSYSIAEKLYQLDKSYWLHTTCGAGHGIAGSPITDYFSEIIDFCYRFVVLGTNEQIRTVIPGKQGNCIYPKYNFCDN